MEPRFQFRLNGVIIPYLILRPADRQGRTYRRELVACDRRLGMFAIDDNEDLPDPALPRFIFEVRDVSTPEKGWQRMTTAECIAFLRSAGVIDRR